MAKIVGGVIATPNPVPDWNQTNPNRADYIKNKPNIPKIDTTLSQAGQAADAKVVGDTINQLAEEATGMLQEITEAIPVLDTTLTEPGQAADAAVVGGCLSRYEQDIIPKLPPAVTAADNGKILQVVNGSWAAVAIPSAEDNTF